jgi:tRNA 2-thiouridine synthesizing protein D
MKYAVQLNASPYASSAGIEAYHFIRALLQADHQVLRVFFYKEGIYHAFAYATPPEDEYQFNRRWSELAQQYQIDLVVCISAAQRRGLLCSVEARRQGKQDDDLASGFRIGGLGLWVEATMQADRCLVFG